MTTCANCGAPLGVGRYCTNCGHRVGVPVGDAATAHDTAERPAVPPAPGQASAPAVAPVEAAPAHEPPPPARFPLFADETAPSPDVTLTDLPAVAAPGVPTSASRPRSRAGVVWGGGVLALLLVAGLALVATRGGEDDPTSAGTSATDAPSAGDSGQDSGQDSDRDSDADSGEDDPTAEAPAEPVDDPVDLGASTTVTAPPPGPPSSDVATGRTVTYVAANMLDGDATTCWRTPGDATGSEIVFRLPAGSVVSSVSLVNGYAKTSRAAGRTYDWYAGNRRVLRAEWIFDDGTTIGQDLIETRDPQRLDVGAIRTDTVRLRLVRVSPPGTGPAAKDNTAISEVTILGR